MSMTKAEAREMARLRAQLDKERERAERCFKGWRDEATEAVRLRVVLENVREVLQDLDEVKR